MARLRPKHFKFLMALNLALVVVVKLVWPSWFTWAVAFALVLTILDVVMIALAQD
jgi:hypothetical protein